MWRPASLNSPGLWSLVFWRAIAIRILLSIVNRVLVRVLWPADMGPVVLIRMSPVPLPLSRVQWWVALIPVLVAIPVVVISVFDSVGVTAGIRPGVTSVIHDEHHSVHTSKPTLPAEEHNMKHRVEIIPQKSTLIQSEIQTKCVCW